MADPKMNNQTQGYSNKQTVKEPVGNQVPGWSPSNSYYKNDNDYYRRRYQDRGSYPAIRRQDGSYIDPDKDF